MKISERQYHAARMLLCTGSEPHACDVPRVSGDGGAVGPVRCYTCGEPMVLVDVITVDRDPDWLLFESESNRRGRTYTDAKLNVPVLLAALASSERLPTGELLNPDAVEGGTS